MRSAEVRRRRAFTLVELMIVVAIIGVISALAMFGVRKYLATAQTVEAKQAVGAIARSAALEYERERSDSELFSIGGVSSAHSHLLCASANSVPANINQVRGRKYQPSSAASSDFMVGSPLIGWQCLGFTITTPIHYQYSYQVGGPYLVQTLPGAPVPVMPEAFEAAARGDLDGDGQTSTIARVGEVRSGQLLLSTQIYAYDELE